MYITLTIRFFFLKHLAYFFLSLVSLSLQAPSMSTEDKISSHDSEKVVNDADELQLVNTLFRR
jgi:hypothetical protein